MHISSYLNRLVQKSITDNEIQLDDKSFERLDNELSLIENEGIAYHFILNHRINTISRKLSMAVIPEYGAISAWYINYCLGISMINPLYRSRRVQQFYRPSIENVAALFTPIPERYQEMIINKLKQEIESDDNLKYYSELNAEVLSKAKDDISEKPLFYSMVLERGRKLSRDLAKIKDEIIDNENKVDGFKYLKYDIFNASFIGEEFFETALINLHDNSLKHNKKIKDQLKPIIVHSFMDNLSFIVHNEELMKMSTEDLNKYSLETISSIEKIIMSYL